MASLSVLSVDAEPSYAHLKLGVVNEDKTLLGLFFAGYLTSMLKGENVIDVSSRAELAGILPDLDGALVIPRGFANDLLFAKPSEIIFVLNTRKLYTSIAIYQVLNNVLAEFRALPVIADPDFMAQVDLDPDYPAPRIIVENISEEQMNVGSVLLPAVIAAGVMLLAGIGASWSVHEELSTDIISLLRISNVKAYEIVASKAFTYLFFAFVMVAVFLLLSSLFGVGGTGSFSGILAVLLTLSLFSISIGILSGVLLGAGKAGQVLAVGVIVALMIVSGFFIPVSIFPEGVQRLSNILPSTRLVEAVQRLSILGDLEGLALRDWISGLLTGIGVLLVSTFVLERRLKNLS